MAIWRPPVHPQATTSLAATRGGAAQSHGGSPPEEFNLSDFVPLIAAVIGATWSLWCDDYLGGGLTSDDVMAKSAHSEGGSVAQQESGEQLRPRWAITRVNPPSSTILDHPRTLHCYGQVRAATCARV
jgi:hypothetical protein